MLEILEVEVGAPHRDLAGVEEQRGVEPRPDLEAVFALEQNRVRPSEAIGAETPQRVVAAEPGHQVVGHARARRGIRRGEQHAAGEDAPFREETDELAEVDVEAGVREGAILLIGVPCKVQAVPAAFAGIHRLPVIDFGEDAAAEKVALADERRRADPSSNRSPTSGSVPFDPPRRDGQR